MMTLTQLEYALAVDRYRHFGKAAKASFVTQPTLSMQLKSLEDELGVSLFDRSKKPILPTPAGKPLIEQARKIIEEAKRLKAMAESGKNELEGEFHLAVIPTLAPYLLPLFLKRLSEVAPKVRFRFRELQTDQIVQALDQDEVDAGLLVTPLHEPKIQELPIFYEPFSLYVSKDHPLARLPVVSESNLDGKDLWLMQEGHCFRSQMMRVCHLKSRRDQFENVRFESGNIETLMRMVERNGGYTLVPALVEGIKNPRAELKSFKKPIPSREVSLVFRRSQMKMPIIEKLAEVIELSIPEKLRALRKRDLEVVEI